MSKDESRVSREDESRVDDDVEAHVRIDRADEGRSDYRVDKNIEPSSDEDGGDVEAHGLFDSPKVD